MPRPAANAYRPDHVSLPGETLQEVLDERDVSRTELAERTGWPPKTIRDLVRGEAAISPEVAVQLERALGIPAPFWSSLQRNYQESIAQQRVRTVRRPWW